MIGLLLMVNGAKALPELKTLLNKLVAQYSHNDISVSTTHSFPSHEVVADLERQVQEALDVLVKQYAQHEITQKEFNENERVLCAHCALLFSDETMKRLFSYLTVVSNEIRLLAHDD